MKLTRRGKLLTLLPLLTIMAVHGRAQGGKTTSTNINVTTIVHDFDFTGTQLLMRSDDYNGTDQATYSATLNAGVQSFLDGSGMWRFNLYPQKQGVRTMWITPNDVFNSSAISVPGAAYYWKNVEIYSACRDQNGNVVPFQNVVTLSGNCSMGVDFNSNGTVYKLFMGPQLPASGPATGLVTVTCKSVSGSQCVSWTIAPNTGAANATVANLYSYTGGHTNPWVYIGQYYNTFRIDVSNP